MPKAPPAMPVVRALLDRQPRPIDMTCSASVHGGVVCRLPLGTRLKTEQAADIFPMTADLLALRFDKRRGNGTDTKKTHDEHTAEFDRRHQHHAGMKTSRQKVVYNYCPVPMWFKTPGEQFRRRERLEKLLQAFLVAAAKPIAMADVHEADMIVRYTLQRNSEELGDDDAPLVVDSVSWWSHIACGNSTAGLIKFRCMHMMCDIVEHNPPGPMILVYSRDTFIPPRFPLPFAPAVDTGKITTHTHHDIASIMLEHVRAGDNMRVRFSRHDASYIAGDKFNVPEPSVARYGIVHVLKASGDAGGDGEGDTKGRAANVDGWEDGLLPKSRTATCSGSKSTRPASHRTHHVYGEEVKAKVVEVVGGPLAAMFDSSGTDTDEETGLALASSDEEPSPTTGRPPPPPQPDGAGSSNGSSSSGSVRPTEANILQTMRRVRTIEEIANVFPVWTLDHRWFLKRGADHHGSIRAWGGGETLKCYCKRPDHKIPGAKKTECAMTIDILGNFEAAQAFLLKWCIAGGSLDGIEHRQAARNTESEWRRDRS